MKNKILLYIYNLILYSHRYTLSKEKYERIMIDFRDANKAVGICEHIYDRAISLCQEAGIDIDGNWYVLLQELASILTTEFCLDSAFQLLMGYSEEENQATSRS